MFPDVTIGESPREEGDMKSEVVCLAHRPMGRCARHTTVPFSFGTFGYFSFGIDTVTTTMKVGGALGIGLAYPLLELVGFNPGGSNDPAQLDALRYIFAFIPAASELLVVYLLYTFPLNEEKLGEIQAQLAKHRT